MVARTLHQALNELPGYESLFVYGRGPRSGERRALRMSLQLEVHLHALLTRATGLQGHGTRLSTRRLLQIVRNWEPDVIHFHNLHGYYLDLSVAEAIGKLGIPVVWTLHDGWPLTGRCAYLCDCDRWKSGCGHCPDLRRYPRAYFDSSAMMWEKKRQLLEGAWKPIIVTPSQWLAAPTREASAGRCRVEVIPNGIDTQLFRPQDRSHARAKLGIPEDKKVVLFAAADLEDKRKGAQYFFEALPCVAAAGFVVVTVGKRIASLPARTAGLEVRQLGYVGNARDLAAIYSAADLLCTTSLDEVFGLVVTEAMACGTPVVGFRVGGIAEQVTEDCGVLVEPKDTESLAIAITQMLVADALRKEMGKQCRARAATEYSLETSRDRYIGLYCEARKGECI
jgi:glycosyltransferase involved in cell wall biosynthesis